MDKRIYLAGGCFWGAEHYLKRIAGVTFTQTGFANGTTENPTYKEVYTDTTGFAETVMVCYDPDVLDLDFLLRMYFKAIDPLSINKQGEDCGTRYRTGIYYCCPEDLAVIRQVCEDEERRLGQKIAVEVEELRNYYPAEEYHQGYLDKNPNGYCHLSPDLFRLAEQAVCPTKKN